MKDISRLWEFESDALIRYWSATSPEEGADSPVFYIAVYSIITTIGLVVSTVRWFVLYNGSIHASTVLYKRLLETVLFANIRFHDTVSRGRLLNRFGKDFEGTWAKNISKDDKQAQIFSDRHRQQPFGQLWKKHHLWFIGCDNFGHCQCRWRTSVYPCGGNPWSHLLERYADIFQARMTRYLTYTALCSRQGLLLLKIIHTTRIELKCYIGIWSNLPGYATSRLVEWHQHRLFSCSSFYRFGHTLSALLYLWGDYFWSSDHPSLWRFFEIFEGYVTMRRHRASISLFRS